MTRTALRMSVGACLIAMTTVAHAATPLTLPLGDLGLQVADVDLPVPPPPQKARPEVTQFRLVIKRQPVRGCDGEERRSLSERRQVTRQVAPGQTDPWVTKPAWSRWG